jgi:hypothetical protein
MGKVYPHLGRLTNKPMNTDYGFFNLFVALDPVGKAKKKPLPTEPDSKCELPEIDYSLLRAVSVVDVKDQDCQFQPQPLGLNERKLVY